VQAVGHLRRHRCSLRGRLRALSEGEDHRPGTGGLDRLRDQAGALAHLDRLVERGRGAVEVALVA
jgi:hypothetical protein